MCKASFDANTEPRVFNARLTTARLNRIPFDSRNPELDAAGTAIEDRAEADMFPRSCLQSVARSTELPDQTPVSGNLNDTCFLRHCPTANALLASSSLIFFFYITGRADQSVIAPIGLEGKLQLTAPIFTFLYKFTLKD